MTFINSFGCVELSEQFSLQSHDHYCVTIVYVFFLFFFSDKKREERLKMPMSRVVESVSKKRLAKHVGALVFEICCNDDTGEDVEVPYVKYILPKK